MKTGKIRRFEVEVGVETGKEALISCPLKAHLFTCVKLNFMPEQMKTVGKCKQSGFRYSFLLLNLKALYGFSKQNNAGFFLHHVS